MIMCKCILPFLLLILLSMPTSILASQLSVGISTGYPPYYYRQDGKLKGICIEIVNQIASELNLEIVYKEFPWKRLLTSAKKGHVDAIMPLFKTTDRQKYLHYEGLGLAYESNHLFSTHDAPIIFDGNFTSLQNYRVGVIADYSYGEQFDYVSDLLKKVTTQNEQHLIEMFTHHRFDIGIGNKYVIEYYAKEKGVDQKIRFIDPPITNTMLYLAFSKKHHNNQLWEKFAAALHNFKETDQYRKLLKKYDMDD